MSESFVCTGTMPRADGSCECGHIGAAVHERAGATGDVFCHDCRAVKKWKRSNYVAAPHFYNLNQACVIVNRAFTNGFGCYLVGSACVRKDYRDVDVRLILDDAEYDRLFGGKDRGGYLNAFWSLQCTTISAWLSTQSGLPVDFQIQRRTEANEQHDGPRHPLGVFLDYPGERPSDIAKPEP